MPPTHLPRPTPYKPSLGCATNLQWYLQDKLQAEQAWDWTTGSDVVRACVIDTGFCTFHTDLLPRLQAGWNRFTYKPGELAAFEVDDTWASMPKVDG